MNNEKKYPREIIIFILHKVKKNLVVKKRIPSQSAIFGYNLFVLLGFFLVAVIIMGRKWGNLNN